MGKREVAEEGGGGVGGGITKAWTVRQQTGSLKVQVLAKRGAYEISVLYFQSPACNIIKTYQIKPLNLLPFFCTHWHFSSIFHFSQPLSYIERYSIILYSILFYSILFYSILFYSIHSLFTISLFSISLSTSLLSLSLSSLRNVVGGRNLGLCSFFGV